MKNLILSKNFQLREFIRSRYSYDNTPVDGVIYRLYFGVTNILQPLRDYLNKPIKITSGYRCPEINRAVGGANNSQHMTGNAVDFVLETNEDYTKAIDFIRKQPFFDQLINEYKGKSRWLHVSWSLTPRHQYFTNINK